MQIAAARAQEIHVDRNSRCAFDGLAVAILRNQQSALLIDELRGVFDLLQLVVRFFHGLGGSLRFGVLVHVVIHGERADRHQDHQHRHHDGADEGLLLALLLHLFGASLHLRGLSGPTLGAAGALLRILTVLGHPHSFRCSHHDAVHHSSVGTLLLNEVFRKSSRCHTTCDYLMFF